jgi:hypothetical protein
MQNVMFTGTLLNVVADAWLRVSQTDAVELGKQAAPPAYACELRKNSPNPTKSWQNWLRETVRRAVIGGPASEAGRIQCSYAPSLLALIKEMEARQRRNHATPCRYPKEAQGSPAGTEHSDSNDSSPASREADEKDYLCLRVVGSARDVIARFNFEPCEYPGGVVS